MTHFCPCCGCDQLQRKPYENYPEDGHLLDLSPPYETHWGQASYNICPCCGYEYGYDDRPMLAENAQSFKQYLEYWFKEEGALWMVPEDKPQNWDLILQLKKARIEVPLYIQVTRQLSGKKTKQ